MVRKWRDRFAARGLDGFKDLLRQAATRLLRDASPNAIMIHAPERASWLNQVETCDGTY
jgi:hypothetical protein